MSFPIVIREKSASDAITVVFSASFPFEKISVRDLITEKVKQEITQRQTQSKITLTEKERKLNAKQGHIEVSGRQLDLDSEIQKALDGFRRNAFFVIIDGEQYTDLERELIWHKKLEVTFLRLIPLVGG